MSDSAILRGLSTAVGVGSKMLPGKAGLVGGIIAEAIALAADFAKAGREPVAAIRRVRDTQPELAAIDARWQAALTKRLGQILAKMPEDSQENIYDDLSTIARG